MHKKALDILGEQKLQSESKMLCSSQLLRKNFASF